jgi:hypothetical protein
MVPFLRFLKQCVNFFHTFDGNNTKISGKQLTVDNFQTVAESINPTKSELHEIHLLFKLDTNCKMHQKKSTVRNQDALTLV